MGVFVVPYTIKDVLAKASKEGVCSLCIQLLVVVDGRKGDGEPPTQSKPRETTWSRSRALSGLKR
jgi:hypothetical protein